MAAVPSAVVLHQAEAHLSQTSTRIVTKRNFRHGFACEMWLRKSMSYERAFSYRVINGNVLNLLGQRADTGP